MNIFTFIKGLQVVIILALFIAAVEAPIMIATHYFGGIFINEVTDRMRALCYPALLILYGRRMYRMAQVTFENIDKIALNH